jgi:UDP-glucuronate decarboxylase
MMRHPIVEQDLAEILDRDLPWNDLERATVLVSGAYGFIPAYLVETLLYLNERRGAQLRVLALVRNREKAERRFASYAGRTDLEFIIQDVSRPVAVSGPIDFIVHAASWASPRYYGKDPVGVMEPNLFGTHNLLALGREKKVKGFLFFSSAETYGMPAPDEIPIVETFPGRVDALNVRSCYAESKRVGETLCAAWHHQHGVPVRIARIFHTYGPGMALDDGRVFADFVANVVKGEDIRMNSEGGAVRAFCYLVDAVDGLLRILLAGQDAVAYNLGNEEAQLSVRELADLLVRLFPDGGLKVVRAAETRAGYLPSAIDRTAPDTTRLRGLGWRPRIGPEDGFRRTVLSFW